ncbi:MAG TPA: transporter [Candidatus Babeliales bacterium]|nr:transporter [Candidatus Babeliales bacterium]
MDDKYYKYIVLYVLLFFINFLKAYGLPQLGLGYTNILDGGPVRPYPGIYWQHWLQYYTTQRFLDNKGKPLGGLPSPRFRGVEYVTELTYQCETQFPLGGMPGVEIVVPFILMGKIEKNELGLASSGAGVGDLGFAAYIQWPAIFYNDRPLFIHRLQFGFTIPVGKNKLPEKNINPSNSFFYCGPNWSATLYLSERWSMSWSWYYVWCAQNEKINFRAGDAIHGNYSLAYEVAPRLYLGAVGYALQQLHNNRSNGLTVPHSKERVFGIGPGAAYFFSKDLIFFSYLYFEAGARNHTQGTNFISRLVLHF